MKWIKALFAEKPPDTWPQDQQQLIMERRKIYEREEKGMMKKPTRPLEQAKSAPLSSAR